MVALIGVVTLLISAPAWAATYHTGEICTLKKEGIYQVNGFTCRTGSDGRLRLHSTGGSNGQTGSSESNSTSGSDQDSNSSDSGRKDLSNTGFEAWISGLVGMAGLGIALLLRRRRTEDASGSS